MLQSKCNESDYFFGKLTVVIFVTEAYLLTANTWVNSDDFNTQQQNQISHVK